MFTLQRILQAAANSLEQGKREAHCSNGGKCAAQNEVDNFDFAAGYGEPGYTNPAKGIVFADWNHFPRGLDDILECAGYAIEWSDEWIVCHETGKAYRHSPDSYGWKPYYVMTDDEIIGGDEIEEDETQRDWYVNEYLCNNPRRANLFNIDLTAYGFKQYEGTFETGWHPGQNDDPQKVFNEIRKVDSNVDVVFSFDSCGQFDIEWTAWTRYPRQVQGELER